MKQDRIWLWIAQGFGSGWVPKGPGTAGSVVGLAWAYALVSAGRAEFFWGAMLAAALGAVWVCGRAERILGAHDPGSVVLDEIVAIPFCLIGPLMTAPAGTPWGATVAAWAWWNWGLVFVLFRVFDIAKPWPVRQVQNLPRGWGVVADDLLAAGWVNVVWLGLAWWRGV